MSYIDKSLKEFEEKFYEDTHYMNRSTGITLVGVQMKKVPPVEGIEFLKQKLLGLLEEVEKGIKESNISYHDEDGVRYLHPDVAVSQRWEEGFNHAVKKVKSHIKDLKIEDAVHS